MKMKIIYLYNQSNQSNKSNKSNQKNKKMEIERRLNKSMSSSTTSIINDEIDLEVWMMLNQDTIIDELLNDSLLLYSNHNIYSNNVHFNIHTNSNISNMNNLVNHHNIHINNINNNNSHQEYKDLQHNDDNYYYSGDDDGDTELNNKYNHHNSIHSNDIMVENSANLYRKEAIQRWLEKRSRRTFRKKTISKGRQDYAQSRERKGGRFVKSKAVGWVGITEVNTNSLYEIN